MAHPPDLIWNAVTENNIVALEAVLRSDSRGIDDTHVYSQTPLFVAATCGYRSIIEKLIEYGSNAIDTPNSRHETPLFAAVNNGHLSTVRTLLRLGSRAINTRDISGKTPLYTAILHTHIDMVNLLLNAGCDVNAFPKNGWPPIDSAVMRGYTPTLKALIQHGARITTTLLHHDIDYRNIKCVKLLKRLGLTTPASSTYVCRKIAEIIHAPINEEKAGRLRYNVYFQRSLSQRLFVAIASIEAIAASEARRRI